MKEATMTADIIRFPLNRITRLPNTFYKGIRVVSGGGFKSEVDRLHSMLAYITDPGAVRGIERLHCKDSVCTVWLRTDCPVPIGHIGAWVGMAARLVDGGHNGVQVWHPDGSSWSLDNDWIEETEPQPA
jgi:hypothetical protein